MWGRERKTLYIDLIQRAPKCHLMLFQTAGNDFLDGNGQFAEYSPELDLAVQDWSARSRELSKIQMTVCGGSEATWGYADKAPAGVRTDLVSLGPRFAQTSLRSEAAKLEPTIYRFKLAHHAPKPRQTPFQTIPGISFLDRRLFSRNSVLGIF